MGCLDDPTLIALAQGTLSVERLAEIDEHLDRCASCRTLVATLARASTTGRSASYLRVGAAVDRYFVLRPLGSGAMGVVYEAYDPQLNRKIALKILRPEPGRSDRDTGELIHEAQAMAQLTHPNVRAVFDVGTVDDQVFIAMENVDGVTLTAWLHQAARTAREVLGMFLDAGAGLAAAHQAGVVHGDFKPDNVLVGADGRVRVTDFGLATYSSDFGETPSPRRGGTRGFMAPEQEAGGPALAQSDQYSFCVALSRALEATQGKVPAALRSLISKGLSPTPADRHASMSALLRGLTRLHQRRRQRWMVGGAAFALVLTAVAVGGWVRNRSQLCKGGAARWAAAWDASRRARMATALGQTGAPYARTLPDKISPLIDAYGQRWTQMFDDACQATWVRGEQSAELLDLRVACLDDRLGEVDALLGIFESASPETSEGAIQAAAALPSLELCADARALAQPSPLPADPAKRKEIEHQRERLSRVDALRLAGKYAQGVKEATEVVSAVQGSGYPPLRAEAALTLGRFLTLSGDRKSAEPPLVESAALALEGRDVRGTAESWIALEGLVSTEPGRLSQAEEWNRYATAAIRALGKAPDLEGTRHLALGDVRFFAGKYADAASEYQSALTLWRQVLPADDPRIADALSKTGNCLEKQARLDEALDAQTQALELRRRLLGAEHPAVAASLDNVARVKAAQKKMDEALVLSQQALALRQNALGPDHPSVAHSLNNVAIMQDSLGQHEAARASLTQALAIKERVFGADSAEYASTLQNLAKTAEHEGKVQEAAGLQERVLSIREARLGMEHPLTAEAHDGVAQAYKAMSAPSARPQALELLHKAQAHEKLAVAIYQRALGPDHPRSRTLVHRLEEIEALEAKLGAR